VLIPDYTGPGGYPESEAFAQITGPAESSRWTLRDAITSVSPNGTVALGRFVLRPEPGTPATGRLSMTGRAACAAADRGAVAAVPRR
jgi:hypothetical protein